MHGGGLTGVVNETRAPRRGWAIFRTVILFILVTVSLAITYLAVVPTRLIEATLVMSDVAAGAADSRLKRRTSAPQSERIEYEFGERVQQALLIWPGHAAARAALVLVPGAAPDGPDDPRLRSFAATLARAGFLVLIPDSPSMRQLLLSPKDADTVADAARHLIERRAEAKFGGIGIAAVSYAVGPAVIAALRADIRDHVDFLFGIGGYYNINDTLRFLTTGHYRAGAMRGVGAAPDRAMIWRFILHNAVQVDPPRDHAALMALARVKLDDEEADVRAFADGLGAEARAAYELAVNRDPSKFDALIARLPRKLRDAIAGLDLARRDLSVLRARLILVHGDDDRIIPAGESVRLAAAVPASRARVYSLKALVHAHLDPLGLPDYIHMWRATAALLAERDR